MTLGTTRRTPGPKVQVSGRGAFQTERTAQGRERARVRGELRGRKRNAARDVTRGQKCVTCSVLVRAVAFTQHRKGASAEFELGETRSDCILTESPGCRARSSSPRPERGCWQVGDGGSGPGGSREGGLRAEIWT